MVLLDEVHYNLEFMLGMQVPEGEFLAGMVHHKVHGTAWDEVGTSPSELDPKERFLTPPTTHATLYFAASAAQCARVWRTIDSVFANRCLEAAEKAWGMAIKNPNVTHPDSPYDSGGGPYGNLDGGPDLEDAFYWAAAELFITTRKQLYKTYVLDSAMHFREGRVPLASFDVDMLARLSLSMIPNNLTESELKIIQTNILSLADQYLSNINNTGFGVPIWADYFYWGSNATLINELMILAYAYDITADTKYLLAVQEGINYIFGRNPLSQSYVTGYGENSVQNPTSTWFANSVNLDRPSAPPGFLVGGANSTIPDLFAAQALEDCVGTTCYLDSIRSYSTNETGINVNASLVWIVSFLLAESDY